MGSIKRFDLGRIIKEYDIQNFFETGTFRGDGILYALMFPFKQITSVEIVPEIASDAKARFENIKNVKIIEADSVSALKNELQHLRGNCVFWLDAHFPGADAGIDHYDAIIDEEIRLPLQKELAAIKKCRKKFHDVIIVDDLRIYEDGPYENGNVPVDAMPKINRSLQFLTETFRDSHVILRSWKDEGYILLFPKQKYKWKHFALKTLFQREVQADYYYAF